MTPADSLLSLFLILGQPPADSPADSVEQGAPDASSPSDSGASSVSDAPADGDAPAAEDPAGDPDSDEEADAAMMDAFFGGGGGEDDGGGEAAAPGEQGEGPEEVVEGGESTETIVGGTDIAPAEDLDMSDIFGSEEDLSEIPDIEEVAPTAGPATGSGLFGGKLDFRARIVSSVYVDIDNLYQGSRWNPEQPTLADSVAPPSAFKVGNAIPRGTVSRNENRLEFSFSYEPNEHIRIVGDVEPVFLGVSQVSGLDDLASRQLLTPFHVESDAAYVGIYDALPNLDIKIGRQIVVWGTADKFNPTNNINPDDLEDRPIFTEPIANQMVVVDFSPLQDKLWFQGVYVPLFYPALLPPSASQALGDPQTPVYFAEQSDRDKLTFLQGFITANAQFNPRVSTQVEQPPVNIMNGQAAFKIGSRLGPVDFSASYYYGFHDIPIPLETQSESLAPLTDDPVDGYWFASDVTLVYPRMHVAGLDFAAQVPFLDDLGLWAEGALIFPVQDYDFHVEMPVPLDITPDDGVANPVTEFTGAIVKKQPFVKATVGTDYTIGKHVYVQAQYLRGMIDDFGAGNIGNYILAGSDLIFFGRHLIFRVFAITELPSQRGVDPSTVIAPNIIMVPPWGYVTLELGGFAAIGKNTTKFGQTATGSSIAFFKVAGAF
ncbi:hypothetical protein PPSIR1_37424 [Plesiocystis pacifica SIR-1]|uniref:Uncharacterized protein n=1 Tax=Plesiocystis pacifica SIR-1 TaxID=391625 RepID=A6GJT9_9BACT|nr:hypothetical protein [Plesiocystis pacifica]EDM73871.1 hypothetical protein PPSIR1_37424 [Plesiocystis pacifica SIR-1]